STGENLVALLEQEVRSWLPGSRRRSGLRLIVTQLGGAKGDIGGVLSTTSQRGLSFDDVDLATPETRVAVFRDPAASGASPDAFVSVDLHGSAGCVDGETVNNTPIKEAIAGGTISRVMIVTPHPLLTAMPRARFSGLALFGRLADILINERLYRD